MHTVRSDGPTLRREHRNDCVHCRRYIVWLITCHDLRPLAFDPTPLPTRYDDGNGWAPGRFPVRAKLRLCFAPLPMHPPEQRRRIAHVMQLHNCHGEKAA